MRHALNTMLLDVIEARRFVLSIDCLCTLICLWISRKTSIKPIAALNILTEVVRQSGSMAYFDLEVKRVAEQLIWIVNSIDVFVTVLLAWYYAIVQLTHWLSSDMANDRTSL